MYDTLSSSVLGDEWLDYNIRKTRANENYEHFDPHNEWELNYLVRKICKHYPIGADVVRNAIVACAGRMTAPYNREQLVTELFAQIV